MRCDAKERYTQHAKKDSNVFFIKYFHRLNAVHTSSAAQQCLMLVSRVAISLMIFSKLSAGRMPISSHPEADVT